jgi:ORF6N domain.
MKDLIPVEYQTQRILTTEQLAEIYETEPRRITENFQRNQDRFIEGKHYYFIHGEELKTFLQDAESVVQNPSKVRMLYLWTERGASRHCKILDTDKAWEQFDNLEETYFNPQRHRSLSHPSLKKLG